MNPNVFLETPVVDSRELHLMTPREAKEHPCLEGYEQCHFLWTYEDAPGNAIRKLILNLKSNAPIGTVRYSYREKAIATCVDALGPALAKSGFDGATIVPVPPSKSRQDPDYDHRLPTILYQIHPPLPDVRELIEQRVSLSSRTKGINASERARLWHLTNGARRPEPRTIVVFDDVIAGGSHFKAAELLLKAQYPSSEIVGVFLARRSLSRTGMGSQTTRKFSISLSGKSLDQLSNEALAALAARNNPPSLLVRGGELVRIRDAGRNAVVDLHPSVERMTAPALRGLLARTARFTVARSWGRQVVNPPMSVVHDLLNLPAWPFPELQGIVAGPVMRRDGTLLEHEGYDQATGLILRSNEASRLVHSEGRPSADDVKQARTLLLEECLGDFPFVSEVDRANAVALLLTPILRPAVPCVPLAVIDAPTPGTGKGLLTSVAALIATGRDASKGTAPVEPNEWRKSITALLLSAEQFIVFDNLTAPLGSPELAAALTTEIWRDRLLGRSCELKLTNSATWVVTGNNVRLTGDLPRRCYWIRLNARVDQPWLREGFRNPQLRQWVRANRARLLGALLTITRHYLTSRFARPRKATFGGFEEWAALVAGILDAAGIPGFLQNRPGRRHAAPNQSKTT